MRFTAKWDSEKPEENCRTFIISPHHQIVVFENPRLHCRSPDSGELWNKCMVPKKRIWSNSEGGWTGYEPAPD